MAKTKAPIYQIKGIAHYPRITKADTKYNEHGTYSANVILPLAEAKPHIDALQVIAKPHMGKALPVRKNQLWYYEVDKETGEETGMVIFKIAVRNREVTDKRTKEKSIWDRKPSLFDSKAVLIKRPPAIGGGSLIKVTAEVYFGKDKDGNPSINLQPTAVQLLKLVEYTGNERSASDYGLEAEEEEGGYVAGDDFEEVADDAEGETPAEPGTTAESAGEVDF
jgi:hypothetical protein